MCTQARSDAPAPMKARVSLSKNTPCMSKGQCILGVMRLNGVAWLPPGNMRKTLQIRNPFAQKDLDNQVENDCLSDV